MLCFTLPRHLDPALLTKLDFFYGTRVSVFNRSFVFNVVKSKFIGRIKALQKNCFRRVIKRFLDGFCCVVFSK